jgi:VanZ family protein
VSDEALREFRRPRLWLLLWIIALKLGLIVCLLPLPAIAVPSGFDKIEHAVGYFLLAAYAVMLFARGRSLGFALLGLLAFGALVEALQALVPWRSAELMDWVANAIGVVLGAGLVFTPASAALQWVDRKLPM